MSAKVGRVDHPVVGVEDLEDARERYSKLGFFVPPAGRHQEWGTANVCIMFPGDYLEIRGIADVDGFLAGLDEFLIHGEGLSGVAFNTRSAKESYEAGRAAGLSLTAPKHLNRRLALGDQHLDLHFENVMLDPELYPGLTHANLCQHLTPDALRQPGWTEHPNGALAFGRVVGVVADMDNAEITYGRLVGSEKVERRHDCILIEFGEGADIELISPEEASRRGDAQPARGPAYIAAATILVACLETAARIFEKNGVLFRRIEKALAIDPSAASGAHLYFQEAEVGVADD